MQSPTPILVLTTVVAQILIVRSSLRIIHRLAQILGRMTKCRLCGPKQSVGFGALAVCLRASFISPKILLMTVLSQGIGSQACPKACPKGKHVQLLKMRRKVGKGFYFTAPDAPDGQ